MTYGLRIWNAVGMQTLEITDRVAQRIGTYGFSLTRDQSVVHTLVGDLSEAQLMYYINEQTKCRFISVYIVDNVLTIANELPFSATTSWPYPDTTLRITGTVEVFKA